MKQFKYIFLLLLFLGFSGRSFGLIKKDPFAGIKKESTIKSVKHCLDADYKSPKVNRRKWPKKPKGIQVIVPNVSVVVFHKFYYHSDLSVHEVEGAYSLLLHYSHGKRGPPVQFV